MFEIRAATVKDAEVITHHRRRMFVDAGRPDNEILDLMADYFEPWVEAQLEEGKYFGWLAVDGDKIAGGAGLMILEWAPHPLDPMQSQRGYLLNVYVEPEYRRRKVATSLIELALAEARHRKIRVVALHATEAGRPLYVSNGFRPTDEMFYVEPADE